MSAQEDTTSNRLGIYINNTPPTSPSIFRIDQIQSPSSGSSKFSPFFPFTQHLLGTSFISTSYAGVIFLNTPPVPGFWCTSFAHAGSKEFYKAGSCQKDWRTGTDDKGATEISKTTLTKTHDDSITQEPAIQKAGSTLPYNNIDKFNNP